MLGFAILAIFMNIMDSITTELGMRQYPEKDLKNEANPIARALMVKSKFWTTVVKQIAIPLFLIYLIHTKDLFTIKCVAIALSLVVINNSFIYVSRAITKRKIISPAKKLEQLLHIPDKFIYPVMLVIIFGITSLIVSFI